jgi:hypothetical protein
VNEKERIGTFDKELEKCIQTEFLLLIHQQSFVASLDMASFDLKTDLYDISHMISGVCPGIGSVLSPRVV